MRLLLNIKQVSKTKTSEDECMISSFCGFELISNINMIEKTNTPKRKNKNKRIQKKWIKRYGYIEKPMTDVYVSGTKIIAHPTVISLLSNIINN